MCCPAKFGRSRSIVTSVITEIRQKNLTIVSRLSRSLKVMGTATRIDPTYDFLLTFHIVGIIIIISLFRGANSTSKASRPIQFTSSTVSQNDGATGPRQMFDGIFSHQDTIHERDRQTLADSKDHDRTQLRTVKIIGPILTAVDQGTEKNDVNTQQVIDSSSSFLPKLAFGSNSYC